MYPAPSTQFLAAMAESHRMVSVVELHPAVGVPVVLDHTGGSVSVDVGSAIRRTCTVTVPDTSLIPITATDATALYGGRLRIRVGVRYPSGDIETVPLGWFRIDEVGGDPDTGPVTIQGKDLSALVADDQFTVPYSTRGGTAAVTAITGLVQRSIPGAVIVNRATDATLGTRTWDREADPWAAAIECATAIGARLYVDPDGQFIIEPLPDMATAPVVWDVAAGPGGVLISAQRTYSRSSMYNSVTAYGENSEDNAAPATATVEDTDPTSPTYVLGPFGRVTKFYSSATLTSTALCTGAANALLKEGVKPTASADITALPNPLLEPGDVFRATYASGQRELHQVRSFTIDLGPDADFTVATVGSREDS